MPAALDGVAIKLDRAAEHLETIDSGMRHYVEVELKNRATFVADIDTDDPGWQPVKWGNIPPPDQRLGAVLGDFVHNVRSALDQLIWQMVKANGGNPGRHTQWPVSETEGQWRHDITHRAPDRGPAPTAGLSDDAFELVRQFQPFRAGKKLRSKDPLLLLHRLSNEDKHRTLHTAAIYPAAVFTSFQFRPTGYWAITGTFVPPRPGLITEGAEVMRVKVREVRPPPEGMKMEVQWPVVGLDLAFTADGERIICSDWLHPILERARAVHTAALALPELTP